MFSAVESPHIMVVDDEPMVRQLVTAVLSTSGYKVVDAGSSDQALRLLEANPDLDLLVTDVVMPDGNGCDLAEDMRKRKPDLRVLFISGYEPAENRPIPSAWFLQKPFRIPELLERVRKILDVGQVSDLSKSQQTLHM
jgi:CheY-like chemotaxis protein